MMMIRWYLAQMIKYLLVALMATILFSCAAPTKTVVMPTTERIVNNDSVIIYYRDSLIEKLRHDTLIIEKYYNKNHYQVVRDTVKTETPIEVQVPVNVTPEWAIWSLLGNVAIAVLIILYVVFKITKTIYLRR